MKTCVREWIYNSLLLDDVTIISCLFLRGVMSICEPSHASSNFVNWVHTSFGAFFLASWFPGFPGFPGWTTWNSIGLNKNQQIKSFTVEKKPTTICMSRFLFFRRREKIP